MTKQRDKIQFWLGDGNLWGTMATTERQRRREAGGGKGEEEGREEADRGDRFSLYPYFLVSSIYLSLWHLPAPSRPFMWSSVS